MQSKERLALLAVFAHPDDESLAMGGTLARYAHAGVEVSLVCATRGEWGSISDPTLASRENLAEVREDELRRACRVLGVSSLRFLDCPDSGVNYTDWPEVEEKIVRHIRELRPDVIVTFGPDGLYGHPDHIAVSTLTTAAFNAAGEADCFPEQVEQGLQPHRAGKLYYAQFPKTLVDEMLRAVSPDDDDAQLWGFDADLFGVPEELITTRVDVTDEVLTKLRALRCHQTQLAADNIFTFIDDDTARRFLSQEYFRLVTPAPAPGLIEEDIFETTISTPIGDACDNSHDSRKQAPN
jgi:LmbE family N-acetylglucosaminyl deacetylase